MRTLCTALIGTMALAAQADTSNVSPAGFTSTYREEVKADIATAWRAIADLPRWWSDAHTWSGKAANMSLEMRAGGCWCERWDGEQSAQHGQVLLAQPGRVVRLAAKLGPLQELPVDGVLTLVTSAQDGKTIVRMTYRVGGSPDTALDKLAPAVDQVMGVQFKRLKALIETGKPE